MSSLCITWKTFEGENLAFASFSRQRFMGKVSLVGVKQYMKVDCLE